MNKKDIQFFLAMFFSSLLLIYSLFAFATLEFNPLKWEFLYRYLLGFSVILFSVSVSVVRKAYDN